MIGQSSNLPGHQGNPGHWPFGSCTNIHAKTAANWVEHAQLLWCFSIHSQVRKSTVEPLSTISQDASRCSGLLRASYLEHVVRTELINITFPLIQGSAHTHTLSYTEAFTYRSFWRVSLYDILWSWTQTVLFLTSSTWWHRALLQTFADISLVKYCHMCHLQHHGTDLFWAIYVGLSLIKWNNMCHTQYHGTELFWAIYVGFSILKWNDMCHTRHHGTELFW